MHNESLVNLYCISVEGKENILGKTLRVLFWNTFITSMHYHNQYLTLCMLIKIEKLLLEARAFLKWWMFISRHIDPYLFVFCFCGWSVVFSGGFYLNTKPAILVIVWFFYFTLELLLITDWEMFWLISYKMSLYMSKNNVKRYIGYAFMWGL